MIMKINNTIIVSNNECPKFEANNTYILTNTIVLTTDLALPENITLIFKGGKFTSETEIKIKGNNTALVAPITPIFGTKVTPTGKWNIDKAYPQWFEPTTFLSTTCFDKNATVPNTPAEWKPATENKIDMADSIQKAINMKESGTVYLIAGSYYITKPIFIPWGITLEGPYSHSYAFNNNNELISATIFPAFKSSLDYNFSCSIKGELEITDKPTPPRFPAKYMVYINTSVDVEKPIVKKYVTPWIALKGICFINNANAHPSSRCIFAASGVQLDHTSWSSFIQAIEYADFYSDGKSITNCLFNGTPNATGQGALPEITDPNGIYAFDLKGLGDALVFKHNHVGTFHKGQKMLFLQQCGGGSIDANIINGDITISISKGVSFTNNHIEGGAQILIDTSIVTMRENFIEKGLRTPLLIRSFLDGKPESYAQNIVSMTGDTFIIYHDKRSDTANPDSDIYNPTDTGDTLKLPSETDIEIDNTAILSLTNVYRNDLVVGFGAVNPIGIRIDTFENNPYFLFNDYSYFASQQCEISRNEQLRASVAYTNINAPTLYIIQKTGHIIWQAPSGEYKYLYSVIWDNRRGIFGHENSRLYKHIPAELANGNGSSYTSETVPLTKNGAGVLIAVGITGSQPYPGLNFMAKLVRYRINAAGNMANNSVEHVTIPIAGSCTLYDDGLSICGYRWKKEAVPGLDVDLDLIKYESYAFNSGHVEAAAYSKVTPPYNGWLPGDTISNIGNQNDWSVQIIKK